MTQVGLGGRKTMNLCRSPKGRVPRIGTKRKTEFKLKVQGNFHE